MVTVAQEIAAQIKKAAEAARDAERERCAKLVEGEVYKDHYRKWPMISADGNRSNDDDVVKYCDALASLIRGQKD